MNSSTSRRSLRPSFLEENHREKSNHADTRSRIICLSSREERTRGEGGAKRRGTGQERLLIKRRRRHAPALQMTFPRAGAAPGGGGGGRMNGSVPVTHKSFHPPLNSSSTKGIPLCGAPDYAMRSFSFLSLRPRRPTTDDDDDHGHAPMRTLIEESATEKCLALIPTLENPVERTTLWNLYLACGGNCSRRVCKAFTNGSRDAFT